MKDNDQDRKPNLAPDPRGQRPGKKPRQSGLEKEGFKPDSDVEAGHE